MWARGFLYHTKMKQSLRYTSTVFVGISFMNIDSLQYNKKKEPLKMNKSVLTCKKKPFLCYRW